MLLFKFHLCLGKFMFMEVAGVLRVGLVNFALRRVTGNVCEGTVLNLKRTIRFQPVTS